MSLKPKKSDPSDRKAVIKYAAQKAVANGKSWYVFYNGAKWVAVKDKPDSNLTYCEVDAYVNLLLHEGNQKSVAS